jgi:hypothetical protein
VHTAAPVTALLWIIFPHPNPLIPTILSKKVAVVVEAIVDLRKLTSQVIINSVPRVAHPLRLIRLLPAVADERLKKLNFLP